MNFRKMTANIESLQIMADASGAPAVVSVGRYRFALDKLGPKVACHGLNATGSAREQLRAAGVARAAYVERLHAVTDNAWRLANSQMYQGV